MEAGDDPESSTRVDGVLWWKCGACHNMTKETHFYPDSKGIMQHESDPTLREKLRSFAERLVT